MYTHILNLGRSATCELTACNPAEEGATLSQLSRAREIVLMHGGSATSYQIINPQMKLWFSSTDDAVAGYIVRNSVRAVAGLPVSDSQRMRDVVQEFELDAEAAGERVCYFGSELAHEDLPGKKRSYSMIQLGAQPSWSPGHWDTMLSRRASVRAQLNRARNKGLSVVECFEGISRSKQETYRCLDEWIASRGLPPLGFLAESGMIRFLYDRRLFLALRENEVVAYLIAAPIPRRNGWLIEQNVRGEKAPNGTSELLIDAAVRAFSKEGCDYATLGLAPLSVRHTASGAVNPLWVRLLFSAIRACGDRFYNFRGIDTFKAKFAPQSWEPVFAISNEPVFSFSTLYALASAFSHASPIRTVLGRIGVTDRNSPPAICRYQ